MKNKFGLLDKDLEHIIAVLSKYPAVEQARIFGSRAKGTYKNGSDVDIVLMGKELSFSIVNRIGYELNEDTPLPYQLDVLNYYDIKEPKLTDHIDRIGVLFYEKQ